MAEPVNNAAGDAAVDANQDMENSSILMSIVNEIIYSPMNMALVVIIAYLVYKIIKDRLDVPTVYGNAAPAEPKLPKLRRDFTIKDLRKFDGTQPDGRVLVAVNGNVYDVTRGKRFYGPGGPYAPFAGRDASRNLATFSVTANDKDEYDDLSDLTGVEMESVREWEMQFKEKYEYVGKLLRHGEQPTNYDEEEDEESTNTSAGEQKTTESQKDEISKVNEPIDGVRNRNLIAKTTSNDQMVN